MLYVSNRKWVHQALVDPKSIVPYYVVWNRYVITMLKLLFRDIEYIVRTFQAFLQ